MPYDRYDNPHGDREANGPRRYDDRPQRDDYRPRYDDRGGYGDRPRRDYDRPRDYDREERDEVFAKRVPAGKRTYFFDVKTTRSGEDYYLVITESKRDGERYVKHKIYLYKEDFGKFVSALHEVIGHVRDEYLPDFDFRGLPELTVAPQEDEDGYDDRRDIRGDEGDDA